ncbi:GerAB/ArcD/ProY family transporter [Paenibacillus piri]|uniref:Spore gernimation protein n=1 Tax=Paenibacillus piri TaxID=2547395 RepID=A0A4R5KZE5_9BACL|nr:endospore germination permease [Paenibacillus piri]TDG00461.1 spore gernimation protein [Paenibacillus piri]
MKKYAFNEITFMQFIFIQFGAQFGFGLLSLPQVLAQQAGTDSLISIVIAWAVSTAASLIIVQVMKNRPDGTLFDLLKHYAGKWVGKAGALFFGIWFFIYGYTAMVRTVLYTKVWLLPQTPVYLIMLLLLIPSYLIARNGLRIVGRYSEFIVFISLWIPFAYLLPLKDAHILNLLPVVKEGWLPILSAVRVTALSYAGLEIAFVLYPFLQNRQKAAAAVVIANTLTMLVLVFITFVCFVYFSPYEITEYNEPVVNVLKTIEFKFIERIETLFIAFYLFIFSLCWISFMYMAVFCTSWIFGKEDHRGHLRIICLMLAIVAFIFLPTFNQSERLEEFLGRAALIIDYGIPCCLLLYVWMHKHFQWRKKLE